MTLSPPKKELFTSAYFARHVGVYLCKFGPTILYVLAVFYFVLYSMCVDFGRKSATGNGAGVEATLSTYNALPVPASSTNVTGYANGTRTIACSPLFHFAPPDSTTALDGVRSLVQGASEVILILLMVVFSVIADFIFFIVNVFIIVICNTPPLLLPSSPLPTRGCPQIR